MQFSRACRGCQNCGKNDRCCASHARCGSARAYAVLFRFRFARRSRQCSQIPETTPCRRQSETSLCCRHMSARSKISKHPRRPTGAREISILRISCTSAHCRILQLECWMKSNRVLADVKVPVSCCTLPQPSASRNWRGVRFDAGDMLLMLARCSSNKFRSLASASDYIHADILRVKT